MRVKAIGAEAVYMQDKKTTSLTQQPDTLSPDVADAEVFIRHVRHGAAISSVAGWIGRFSWDVLG